MTVTPPHVAERLRPFGTTIFTEMTLLAQRHGAVNLAQGFPDFDGPAVSRDAATAALAAGHDQYARSFGLPILNRAIAQSWQARTGRAADPDTCITVTSGCTEAIAATMLGLLNPGDEVILFEPFYDSYRACVVLAGAVPRFVTLRPDASGIFRFDERELAAAFTTRTRLVLVNTPHNPTGKVFERAELDAIAALAQKHGALAVTDEVYEHLTYEPTLPHISLATLPGMEDRTITLSSLGKSYNLTGWKIGWAIAPPALTAAVRAAHQFLTFATATALQAGAAAILNNGAACINETRELFRINRDELSETLREIGLRVFPSHGTYFIMAEHAHLGFGDDRTLARRLIENAGVAAIPPSVFYSEPSRGASFLRFAYCKKRSTIHEARQRLRAVSSWPRTVS